MVPTRKPRSRFYDGLIYGRLVDPVLSELHAFIARRAAIGSRVLDACCGTGALAFRLGPRCSEVVSVDLSPRNIDYAERKRQKIGIKNVRFEVGDAAHLDSISDGEFDLVMLVLALHEMPAETRVPLLHELARVARRIMVVDYNIPMPWNPCGLRNRIVELAAGPVHFREFRDFTRRGGLRTIVEGSGLESEREHLLHKGTLEIRVLHKRALA